MLRLSEQEFAEFSGGKAKRSRELNVPCDLDGLRFSSRLEAKRYAELMLLQQAGVVRNVSRQVPFTILEKGLYGGAIKYVADFVYVKGEKRVIEDVKAIDRATGKHRMTELFRLKWKFMQSIYGDQYTFTIWPEKDGLV